MKRLVGLCLIFMLAAGCLSTATGNLLVLKKSCVGQLNRETLVKQLTNLPGSFRPPWFFYRALLSLHILG